MTTHGPQSDEQFNPIEELEGTHLERWMETRMIQEQLPRMEKEYVFHPTRKWRFDFADPDYKIAIECEGGTWVKGAHTRGKHFESDCEKYNEAARLGWRVFRFTTDMIRDDRAVTYMKQIWMDELIRKK